MRVVLKLGVLCVGGALAAGACANAAVEPLATRVNELDLAAAEVGPGFATNAPAPMLARVGHSPSVAFDGERYAVVFEDAGKVRAVRAEADGTVLDLSWLDFGVAGKTQLYPSAAYGAGKFLAVWSESEGDGPITIRARWFEPDGKIDGTDSFAVSSGDAIYPSVTFDGQAFVIAFLGLAGNGENDVQVARVDVGATAATLEMPVTSNGFGGRPVIAHGGAQTLVAWEDRTNDLYAIRAARLDAAGSVLDPGGFRLSDSTAGEYEPAVAAVGSSFLVAYRRDGEAASVRGSVVGANGTVSSKDLAISRSTLGAGLPAVAGVGDDFLVAWADERDEHAVYGTRVSSAGTLLDAMDKKLSTGAPRSTTIGDPIAIGAGDGQFLIAFIGDGVQGSLIDGALAVSNGNVPLSAVANAQSAQQVSWTGQNYVISWIDERSSDFESYDGRAVRIGADGQRLDSDAIVLTEPGAFSLSQTASASGGWLAAWTSLSEQKVFSRNVPANGTPGTVRELTTREVSSAPVLASNGSAYLSAYTAFEDGNTYTVYGRAIAADGLPGPELPIISALPQPPGLSLAAHGDEYLLALQEQTEVRLLTVNSAGTSVGTPLDFADGRGNAAIASNGERALIAFIDAAGAVSARLYEDGALEGSIALAATSSGFGPAVAWDGETFVVAWDENETGVLKARTVAPDGTASATRTLVDDECVGPVLASNGDGQLLLTCLRFAEFALTRRLVSYFIGSVPDAMAPPGATGGRSNQGTGGRASAGGVGASGEPSTPSSGGTNGSGASAGTPAAGAPSSAGNGSVNGGASAGGRSGGTGGGSLPPAGAGGSATSPPPPAPASGNSNSDDGGCSVHPHTDSGKSALALALCLGAALASRRRRS